MIKEHNMKLYYFKLIVSMIRNFMMVVSFFLFSCNIHQNKDIDYKTITSPKDIFQINWIGNWLNEGDKEKLMREEANEYEFLNQNIKINLKFPEEIYGAAGEQEQSFIESQVKKPVADWDIVRVKFINPEFAEKYFVDFKDVPGFIEHHKPFMNTTIYKKRNNGSFYGPHIEGMEAALFVNTEVAKKIGITVKQFDMTIDDFISYIKAVNEYNKSHPHVIPVFEYDWGKTEIIFKTLLFSLLDNFEEVSNNVTTDKKLESTYKCYQAFEQLSKYNPIEENWSNHKWTSDNDYILRDSCLFFPNFIFMYNIWKAKDKDKMDKIMPCEFPVFKNSSTYVGGYFANFEVLKNAPHKEEAIKIMMYMCRPELAEKWARYTKSSSGTNGNLTKTAFGIDRFENYIYVIDNKYGSNMVGDRDMGFIGRKGFIDLKVQDVLLGKITAKSAMDDLRRKLAK